MSHHASVSLTVSHNNYSSTIQQYYISSWSITVHITLNWNNTQPSKAEAPCSAQLIGSPRGSRVCCWRSLHLYRTNVYLTGLYQTELDCGSTDTTETTSAFCPKYTRSNRNPPVLQSDAIYNLLLCVKKQAAARISLRCNNSVWHNVTHVLLKCQTLVCSKCKPSVQYMNLYPPPFPKWWCPAVYLTDINLMSHLTNPLIEWEPF